MIVERGYKCESWKKRVVLDQPTYATPKYETGIRLVNFASSKDLIINGTYLPPP